MSDVKEFDHTFSHTRRLRFRFALKSSELSCIVNSMIETTDKLPDPLVFSDSAASKVRQLIAEEENEELMLRVFISGGGCSGFQYGFTFDESVTDGDTVVEKEGVKLLIDPMSIQYLTGAEIDYSESLEGAQFVIRNPNAQTTCGCGSSFSV